MSVRDTIDSTRSKFVKSKNAATRAIDYIRSRDDLSIPLNVYVGGGEFSKEEKETIQDFEMFRALELEEEPITGVNGDTLISGNTTYRVRRFSKLGTLYSVVGQNIKHRGRG